MNDAAWLQRYAGEGDAEAFALLVSRYESMVFATCRRKLHDVHEVEDAVQEVFLRLACKAGELRSNIGGWLHRCAVNVAMDFNRRREARARREAAVARREGTGGISESQELLSELRQNLDDAMAQLDADARELLIQRFFVGRSQVELAAEAGVAPSTIANRLSSAVQRLRSCMKRSEKGLALGAAVLVAALEAEKACASVPAGLSAAVMKIGLSGVGAGGTQAVLSPIRRLGMKAAIGVAVAALLLMLVGLAFWWSAGLDRVEPTKVAAAATSSTESWSERISPPISAKSPAIVTAQVRVWTPEGMPATDPHVKLVDTAGGEHPPADSAADKFAVAPGRYWVVVQLPIGEPQAHLVEIPRGKDGTTAVDVLLR